MSTEANPTPAENPGETSAIREMRARIDAQNAELKAEKEARAAAEAKVKDAERAKLEENERLKLELEDRDKKIADLEPLKDRVQSFETRAQGEYDALLATVPDDKRDLLKSLSEKGSAVDSLAALRSAVSLLPQPATPVRTSGQPAPTSPVVTGPQAAPFDPKNPWGGAFKTGA